MILAYWEDSPAVLETSMNVTHSTSCDSKAVIKYACGHEFLAFQDFYQTQEGSNHVPFYFSSWYAITRRSYYLFCLLRNRMDTLEVNNLLDLLEQWRHCKSIYLQSV